MGILPTSDRGPGGRAHRHPYGCGSSGCAELHAGVAVVASRRETGETPPGPANPRSRSPGLCPDTRGSGATLSESAVLNPVNYFGVIDEQSHFGRKHPLVSVESNPEDRLARKNDTKRKPLCILCCKNQDTIPQSSHETTLNPASRRSAFLLSRDPPSPFPQRRHRTSCTLNHGYFSSGA